MVEFNYTAYGAQQDLVTGVNLDTLGIDAQVAIGNAEEIVNSANRDFYMDVEVELVAVDLSGQTNPSVDLYLFAEFDGANYGDVWKNTANLVAVIPVEVGVGAQIHRAVFRGIIIPPCNFKVCPVNSTGVAFTNDVNNHITCRTYSEESN